MPCIGSQCPVPEPNLLRASASLVIGKQIGEGAFGVVNHAHYLMTPVAVKRMKGELDGQARAAFAADLSALTELRHPNIISIIAHSSEMIIMPLASTSLRSYCEGLSSTTLPGHTITFQILKKCAIDCCAALLYMHHHFDSCVIHNDIKPDNILLEMTPGGEITRAMLGDVGIASACTEARGKGWRGTPGYVPQVRSHTEPNPGYDAHALAVSLMSIWSYPMQVTSKFVVNNVEVAFNTLNEGLRSMPRELQSKLEAMLRLPAKYSSGVGYMVISNLHKAFTSSVRENTSTRTKNEFEEFAKAWESSVSYILSKSQNERDLAMKTPAIFSTYMPYLMYQMNLAKRHQVIVDGILYPVPIKVHLDYNKMMSTDSIKTNSTVAASDDSYDSEN